MSSSNRKLLIASLLSFTDKDWHCYTNVLDKLGIRENKKGIQARGLFFHFRSSSRAFLKFSADDADEGNIAEQRFLPDKFLSLSADREYYFKPLSSSSFHYLLCEQCLFAGAMLVCLSYITTRHLSFLLHEEKRENTTVSTPELDVWTYLLCFCSNRYVNEYSLLDDDGASHLDILMSEFDPSFSSPCPTQVKHVRPSNGCVRDLRTLEDQLEAALASLTFTINKTSATMHAQQRSSDSSASSSGVGEEMGSEAFNLYTLSDVNQQQPETMTVQLTSAPAGDDVDSAFSDSGSTDKVLGQSHHDEAVRHGENANDVEVEPLYLASLSLYGPVDRPSTRGNNLDVCRSRWFAGLHCSTYLENPRSNVQRRWINEEYLHRRFDEHSRCSLRLDSQESSRTTHRLRSRRDLARSSDGYESHSTRKNHRRVCSISRTDLRRPPEVGRGDSHVANDFVQSTEFHETIGEVFAVPHDNIGERISPRPGHRRDDLSEGEIS